MVVEWGGAEPASTCIFLGKAVPWCCPSDPPEAGTGQGWLPPTGPLTLPQPWPSDLQPAPPASALKTHKPIKPGVLIGCDSSFCCLAFGY